MSARTIFALAAGAAALALSCAHGPPAASQVSGRQAVEECRAALDRGETEAALTHLIAARASADPAVAADALALQGEVVPRVLDAVEGLRAVRKIQPYEAALRLLDRVVTIDASQQPLRQAVADEADQYLWEHYLKLEREREVSLEKRSRGLNWPKVPSGY